MCDRHGTDAVRTRLMGRPVVLMRGGEAARLFELPAKVRSGVRVRFA